MTFQAYDIKDNMLFTIELEENTHRESLQKS